METVSAVSSWLTRLVVGRPVQVLDPISTLCTLALRTLEVYKDARPAVRYDCFEYDLACATQGAQRRVESVSHEDLSYLDFATFFLVKRWDAKQNPDLVKIAKVAIQGLKQTRLLYAEDYNNAVPACKLYKRRLEKWIQSATKPDKFHMVGSEEEKKALAEKTLALILKLRGQGTEEQKQDLAPSLALMERGVQRWKDGVAKVQKALKPVSNQRMEFKKMVDAIWTPAQITAFATLLDNKEQNAGKMTGALADNKKVYLRELYSEKRALDKKLIFKQPKE